MSLLAININRVLKNKPSRIEGLLINHNLNNRQLSKASILKLESIKWPEEPSRSLEQLLYKWIPQRSTSGAFR
jgi:hypothetical protein